MPPPSRLRAGMDPECYSVPGMGPDRRDRWIDGLPSRGHDRPRPPAPADEPHEGAARLTGDQVSAISRFPDDNPNPVMRVDADGHLIYAQPGQRARSSGRSASTSATAAGRDARPARCGRAGARLRRARGGQPDVRRLAGPDRRPGLHEPVRHGCDGRASHREVPGPEPEPGHPDRLGRPLAYANPASAALVAGLGLAIGTCLPADLRTPSSSARERRPRDGRDRGGGRASTRCCRWTSPSSASSTSTARTSRR